MGLLSADNPRDTFISWMFVIVQFALLLAILVLAPGDAWPVPPWLDRAAQVLELTGVVVLVVAFVNLGRSLTPLPSPVPHGELRTGGLYRLVRHPIYTGVLALSAGAAIRSASLLVAAAAAGLAVWFCLKARWEEARLRDRYPGYADYASRTPRFVPFLPPPRH